MTANKPICTAVECYCGKHFKANKPDHPIEECTIDCFDEKEGIMVPPKDKPMTADERAEFIESQLRFFERKGSAVGIRKAVDFVAEQIRLAEEEARKEALLVSCGCTPEVPCVIHFPMLDKAYAQGFAEAKEKAAQFAEIYQTSLIAVENKGTGVWESKTVGEYIAMKIRTLTPTEGLSDEAKADMKKFHKADGGRE